MTASSRGPVLTETSHSLLGRLAQDADPASWERLVEVYTPLLRSWLKRYDALSAADVDDLVQDVLLAVSKDLREFRHNREPGAFRGWLRVILVNRVRKFWRSRDRRPLAVGGSDFLEQIAQLEDQSSRVSGEWNREHDRHVLRTLLGTVQPRFSEQTWEAFRRQLFDGRKAADVADELGLSLDSVYAAKSRILLALRNAADGMV